MNATNDTNRLKRLKFASGPATRVRAAWNLGQPVGTIRYDDEKNISEGDHIELIAAQTDEEIARGEATFVTVGPAREVFDAIDSHDEVYYTKFSLVDLTDALSYYYPDADITEDTEMKGIVIDHEWTGPDHAGSIQPANEGR